MTTIINKEWVAMSRISKEYRNGARQFVNTVQINKGSPEKIQCPCRYCLNVQFHHYDKVYEHLIINGFDPTYKTWVFHGESQPEYVEHEDVEMLEEYRMFKDAVFDDDMDDEGHDAEEPPVKKGETDFENMVKDAELPLYMGCTYTKMSATVALYKFKARFGLSNKCYDEMLEVIGSLLPEDNRLPDSLYSTKKVLKAFDLGYIKIHACVNDGCLFRKDKEGMETCPKCSAIRWKVDERTNKIHKGVPAKRKKSDNPDDITRADVWVEGHEPKNGIYKNEAAKESVEKVKKLIEEAPEDQNSNNDDAISKVICPKRRGRIRGLGFGATKTKVQRSNFNRDKVSRLESQMKEMNDRMNQLDEILRNKQNGSTCVQGSQNSAQLPTQLNVAPMLECGSNPSGVEGRKCELLDWLTEKVVGKGEIASTDPTSCVNHVPIGKGCWKVWVQEVFDDSVSCYRPTREFFLLHEALSSALAWPIEYIRVIES